MIKTKLIEYEEEINENFPLFCVRATPGEEIKINK